MARPPVLPPTDKTVDEIAAALLSKPLAKQPKADRSV